MDEILSNVRLDTIITGLVIVAVLWQKVKGVEKAIDHLDHNVEKVNDSVSKVHTRVNQNTKDIYRHEGILQTIVPVKILTSHPEKQPSVSGAD